jgi:Domain of unknown function (DUF6456)
MARRRTRAARRIAERTAANARRRDEAIAEQEPPRPARARHKTQLEFLENRGSISTGQRRAGERLARDFQIAGGMPRVIAPYQASAGRPQRRAFVFNGEDGPRQIDARRRFESAIQAAGLQLNPLLMHVAVLDLPLADWSRPGMHNGDGAALLRLALDVLADHYRRPPADDQDAPSPDDLAYIEGERLRQRRLEANP